MQDSKKVSKFQDKPPLMITLLFSDTVHNHSTSSLKMVEKNPFPFNLSPS